MVGVIISAAEFLFMVVVRSCPIPDAAAASAGVTPLRLHRRRLANRPVVLARPVEQVLAVLIDAGLPPVTALRLYCAYFALLYGNVLNELQETVLDRDESKDLLRLGLRRLPPTDFIHIRSLESELGNYDLAELGLGLQILFTGIGHPQQSAQLNRSN
jgi:hypothetical protein